MFKKTLPNQNAVSLSSLRAESPPNLGHPGSKSSWAANVRQLYVQSGQFGPLPLPFPTKRLLQCQSQALLPYQQLSSKQGSFVLLNTDNLPAGGEVHEEKTNCASVSVKLVGDVGLRGKKQFAVAKSIEYSIRNSKRSDQHPLVLVVGDWVYPRGPENNSPQEVKRTQGEVLNVYQTLTKKCSVRGVLGNHEYGDNKMASDPAVFMDLAKINGIQVSRYGRHSIESKNFNVDVFLLDSTVIAVDDKQVQWVSDEISKSMMKEQEAGKKTWRIITSHHPIVSFGLHASETTFISELFDTSHVDLWLSGHEHDIEIIPARTNSPPTIVSGTGSTQRPIDSHPDATFLSNKLGFVNLQINEYDIQIKPELIEVAREN
jgi:Calcineurin-like phosphoesterase